MGTLAPSQQPWRWPLGWLYVLMLGLDTGFVALYVWVAFQGHYNRQFAIGAWFWLVLGLGLVVAGVGLLALVLVLVNAFRRRAGRALAWLGLSALAVVSCVMAYVVLFMVLAIGAAVENPPLSGQP